MSESEHELKVWPPFFEDVEQGRKPFEVRKNDRGFKVGDTLRLREFDPEGGAYSGRECRRCITYVLGTDTGDLPTRLQPGICVLGLAPVDRPTVRAEGQTVYIERPGRPGGFRFDVAESDSAEGVAAVLNAVVSGRPWPCDD